MTGLVLNTVSSAIMALSGLSQRPFTSEAQMMPLLEVLVNARTIAERCAFEIKRHQKRRLRGVAIDGTGVGTMAAARWPLRTANMEAQGQRSKV